MEKSQWVQDFPASITVCDAKGVILEMNEGSVKEFENYGGLALIGKSLLDCHNPASCAKLDAMLANEQPNVYTIQKNGKRKLVYQHPWYKDGMYAGFVEIILALPEEISQFNRD